MNGEGTITWLWERRWKYVNRYGKRALRKLDHYFAQQSLVPNTPVFEPSLFPWVTECEAHWRAIRAELDALLRRRRDLPRFQDISPDQKRISPDDKWRIFAFYGFGYRSEQNCRLCPQTAQLLDRIPGIENAFFSILAPGKQIPSHQGITKGLLRCHVGLIVPPDPERCFMEVGEVRCPWQEGRALIFDDTYPHWVRNETDQERVVLLFDFPRPMRSLGSMVRQIEFWLFRRSPYVQDARRNEAQWEARVREMWT